MMKTLLGSVVFSVVMLAAPMAKAQMVRVRVAPPAPIVETIPVAPSPRHVWVPGYHRWQRNRHVWVPGYYQVPRPGYTRWEHHRWENRNGQYHFHPGGWRR